MGSKKVRIQFEDSEGSKYSILLEGNIKKEKIIKIAELMELLEEDKIEKSNNVALNSIGDKLWYLIEEYCQFNNFTSSKLVELYEDYYNEPIKLSIISTYLARFTKRGLLTRVKGKNEWIYKRVLKNSRVELGS
jgi:hypothetical protein